MEHHSQHPIKQSVYRGRTPNLIGQIIFASRWLQLPIYLGLIVV